jgi:hypothetical protein
MKKLLLLSLVAVFLFSCGTPIQTVSFNYKRTPLNPIAYHQGVTTFKPQVELTYAQNAEMERELYEQEVARLRKVYEDSLVIYNNTPLAQRIVLGMKPPTFVMPVPPTMPYMYDAADLASKISIDGMTRGENNPLLINVFLEGYQVGKIDKNVKTKKRKQNEIEYIDTTYSYSAKVKHEARLYAQVMNGTAAEYNHYVPATQNFKTISGKAFKDTLNAYDDIIATIKAEEQKIAYDNITHINVLLNSEFGTSEMKYSAQLHAPKSSKKRDLSDLDDAIVQARMGFEYLSSDPNKGVDYMNKAIGIWESAMREYSGSKKARISPDVLKAILKNAATVAIYTNNWEFALKYMNQLKGMKLKSSDQGHLSALNARYTDLKKRYDALQK